MRPIAKSRFIDNYNNMSKNQLISLINNLSPSRRPVFKIKQYIYISQLSKKESKNFIHFNYDYISSKSKDEVDRVLKNTQ